MARERLLLFILTVCCVLPAPSAGGDEKEAVGLILVLSNSTKYNSVKSVEAVREGIKDVNKKSGLLTEYQLEIADEIVPQEPDFLGQLFDAFLSYPLPVIGIINGGYLGTDNALLSFSKLWSLPLISYSPFDRMGLNGSVSLFSDMGDTLTALNEFVRHFGWKEVTIISEIQEAFLKIGDDFISKTNLDNITVDVYHISRLQSNFSQFFEGKYKIVILNTFEDTARKILCEASHRQKVHPYYTWIIFGWYSEDWLVKNMTDMPCTIEQMIEVLERVIIIQNSPVQNGKMICTNALFNQTELMTSLAMDAVTTFALALNKSISRNEEFIDRCGVKDLTLNKSMDCKMSSELLDVVIMRKSGPISFDQNGFRSIEHVQYMQFRRGTQEKECIKLKIFAVFEKGNSSFIYIDGENNSTLWPDGIPRDSSFILTIVSVKTVFATVILYFMASLGILFTLVCLIFNIIFRKRKIIRLTTPNLNYFIVCGVLILYMSVYLRMARTNNATFWKVNCHMIIWTLFLGYCLCFSSYLAKIWRIYYIFHNPTSKKKKITDTHLAAFVVVEIIICLVLLIFGTGLPFTRPVFFLADDLEKQSTTTNKDGIEVHYLGVNCFPLLSFLWIGIVILFYALQHGYAIFVALKIRKVKIKVLNEFKEVSATIYVSTLAMAEGLAISVILQDYETIVESLVSTAIIIVATTYVGFTFIPKMKSLYYDPEGKKIFTQENSMYTTTEDTAFTRGSTRLDRDGTLSRHSIRADKDRIKSLEDRIVQLNDQLQAKNGKIEKTDDLQEE